MKKKLIILLALTFSIVGCQKVKQEEVECPEPEEKILIKYNDKEITNSEAIEVAQDQIFEVLFEKVKGDLLKSELPDYIETAKENAEDTIEELEAIYGEELEEAIKQNTSYNSIEEYEEALLIAYLEEEYLKRYICEKEKIDTLDDFEENSSEYYKKYYIKALKALFKKYDVSFENKEYKELYNEYLENLESYYENY